MNMKRERSAKKDIDQDIDPNPRLLKASSIEVDSNDYNNDYEKNKHYAQQLLETHGNSDLALFEAVKKNWVEVGKILILEHNANPNAWVIDAVRESQSRTSLHYAVQQCSAATCEMLLQHGANPHIIDDWDFQRTPLYMAIIDSNSEDPDKIRELQKICELLLQHNANPNKLDEIHVVPLHFAIECCDAKLCMLLLQYGANVNVIDVNGGTPLSTAAEIGSEIKYELLIQHGANPFVKDNHGKTLLSRGPQSDLENYNFYKKLIKDYAAGSYSELNLALNNIEMSFDEAIVIGATLNGQPVTRAIPRFEKAITTPHELLQAIHNGQQFKTKILRQTFANAEEFQIVDILYQLPTRLNNENTPSSLRNISLNFFNSSEAFYYYDAKKFGQQIPRTFDHNYNFHLPSVKSILNHCFENHSKMSDDDELHSYLNCGEEYRLKWQAVDNPNLFQIKLKLCQTESSCVRFYNEYFKLIDQGYYDYNQVLDQNPQVYLILKHLLSKGYIKSAEIFIFRIVNSAYSHFANMAYRLGLSTYEMKLKNIQIKIRKCLSDIIESNSSENTDDIQSLFKLLPLAPQVATAITPITPQNIFPMNGNPMLQPDASPNKDYSNKSSSLKFQ